MKHFSWEEKIIVRLSLQNWLRIKIQLNLCCWKNLKYFLLWPMPSFFKIFLKGYSKNSCYRIMHRIGGKFLFIIEDELTCESVGGNRAEQIGGQVQDLQRTVTNHHKGDTPQSLNHCCGSVIFWYGSGYTDPYNWLRGSGSCSFRQWPQDEIKVCLMMARSGRFKNIGSGSHNTGLNW